MPDVFTTSGMMSDHLADCYQARGISPVGADQVANQQAPSSAVDKAMLGAFSPAPYPEMQSKSSGSLPTLFSPAPFPNMPSTGKKGTLPPGTQTVPSQPNVVSMG